jgi:hypothetical protein
MSLFDKADDIPQLPGRLLHAVKFIRNHHLPPFSIFFSCTCLQVEKHLKTCQDEICL